MALSAQLDERISTKIVNYRQFKALARCADRARGEELCPAGTY